jgi:hypothetical protein
MTTGGDICTAASGDTCKAGSNGDLGGEINFPSGVAIDTAGNVYVADQGNNRIQKFTSSGTFERTWGKTVNMTTSANLCTAASLNTCQAGSNTTALGGEFNSPTDVATDAGNNVYVADQSNNRIQRFNSLGTFERTWGKGVNMTTGGNLCTAASLNTCQAGSTGPLGGEFIAAFGIATDAGSNVYVADTFNHRIQKFDSFGTFDRTWGKGVNMTTGGNLCTAASLNTCKAGSTGPLGGELNTPDGVATDAAGNVYVADTFNHRIQKFDSVGTWDRAWGRNVDSVAPGLGFEICTTAGSCKAADASTGLGGDLKTPTDVAADAGGSVYVADAFNQRIQKFADPIPPPPPSGGGGGSTPAATPLAGPTGLRAAALKKCKHKHGRARANCKKRANKLPV